jgi:hypothetical protein
MQGAYAVTFRLPAALALPGRLAAPLVAALNAVSIIGKCRS